MEGIQKIDALEQRANICSNLLHRIRVIQGQTSLNFAEPHFTESKEYLRQPRNVINNTTENSTTTTKQLVPNIPSETTRKTKKRPAKTNSDKPEEKNAAKSKKNAGQDGIVCYEYEDTADQKNNVKLSHIFSRKEEHRQKDTCGVREAIMEGAIVKINKKKKKRKRKIEDLEISSSMSINHSDTSSIKNEDDTKLKHRKYRTRSNARKMPQCAGDESDVEDEISTTINDADESATVPKRKLRNKKCVRNRPKDIHEIVNSTIEKLNTVNQSVQKVINDSSGSSLKLISTCMESPAVTMEKKISSQPEVSKVTYEKPIIHDVPMQSLANTGFYVEQVSPSSLNWSIAAMCKPNNSTEVTSITNKIVINPKVAVKKVDKIKEESLKSPKQAPSVDMSVQTSTDLVDKVKKKKHRVVEEKPTEMETLEKRNKKIAEPKSSMKKPSGSKKNKRKEHVNFIATPEVVPASIGDATPMVFRKRIPDPDLNKRKQLLPPKTPPKDPPKRRANSARIDRPKTKSEMARIRSASHILSKLNDTILEEKRIHEEPSVTSVTAVERLSRSPSQNSRPDSRDLREIYESVRANTTHAIANINEQMSATLKNSIAHLNEICSKVRTTLSDMEKDEQTYKKLKSKKSFEMSSEAGSVCSKDNSLLSLQSNNFNAPEKHERQQKPIKKTQIYTLVNQDTEPANVEKLMETITMEGDSVKVQMQQSDENIEKEPPIKKKSRSKRKRTAIKKSKPLIIHKSSSKTKCVTKSNSAVKNSNLSIPIWQKKPPSVIEEIQLTVKKQATKSQYRGFLRTLKYIVKKRSQPQVLPSEFKSIMERHNDKAFDSLVKQQKSIPRKVVKEVKDAKEAKEVKEVKEAKDAKEAKEVKAVVNVPSNKKICSQCTQEKCTCGVTVENTGSYANHQRMQWIQTRADACRRGIQSLDILDEITLKDLEPIQSEYPRKDHIHDSGANKRVEDTFLYKLLYHEDPKVLESLLRCTEPVCTEPTHLSRISLTNSQSKIRSVSDAYKLYEEFELNAHQNPSTNLVPNKASMPRPLTPTINGNSKQAVVIESPIVVVRDNKTVVKENRTIEKENAIVVKERQKALHTCPKEFNDNVVIPVDLKPTLKRPPTPYKKSAKKRVCQIKLKSELELGSLRNKKRIEDKMKVIGKKSSIKSIGKLNRNDPKIKMKKILTVMNVLVPKASRRNFDSIAKSLEMQKTRILENVEKDNQNMLDLSISEENREMVLNMSKRDVVRILKPYIFFDLQTPVVTVMPVFPKYYHQNKNQKQDHPDQFVTPACKKITGFLKDHDDDCNSGKKLFTRCPVQMQSGDERYRKNETNKYESLTNKQLWQNKYKPTPAENIVTAVLGKKHTNRHSEAELPERSANHTTNVILTPTELRKNANSTRNKLNEIKNIVKDNKPVTGEYLDEIISTVEFKIVDVLSHPQNQNTSAFVEIENEIKSILNTISDLKEINAEHIQKRNKFKSITDSSLQESSETDTMRSTTETRLKTTNNNRSNRETSIKAMCNIETRPKALNNINNRYIQEEIVVVAEKDESKQEMEMNKSEETLEITYDNLGKDIEKVIDGLDTIMAFDLGKNIEKKDDVLPEKQDNCEAAITMFCEQVDEVMKDIGNIEEFNISTDNLDDYTADIPEKKSDEYLTPFMKAVKNYRQNDHTQSFVDFLDKLTIMSKDNVCLHIYPNTPVYVATVQQKAQILEVVKTYSQAVQYDELANKSIQCDETTNISVEIQDTTNRNMEIQVAAKRSVESQETVNKDVQFQEMVNKNVETQETANRFAESEDPFYETEEFVDKNFQTEEELPDQDNQIPEDDLKDIDSYVLATNQWMQTETIIEEDEIVEEVEEMANQLIQTTSTDEQFHEIEQYLESIQPITPPLPAPVVVFEKITQIPNDDDHTCFAEIATKDVQVTPDLHEMNSVTVASQATEKQVRKISKETSASELEKTVESIGVFTDDLEPKKESFEKSTSAASIDLEKFTNNRKDSCLYDDTTSNISLDEYPRSICTDTCIPREKNSQHADLHLCEKTNSYPETKVGQNKSDIISLYEYRKSYSGTTDMMDFLEGGFQQANTDSYDSMLARCASSENSAAASSVMMQNQMKEPNIIALNEPKPSNVIRIKLSHIHEIDSDKLHKHVLHSVYGIVFALVFLGINLNYSC